MQFRKVIIKGAIAIILAIAPQFINAQDSLHLKQGDLYYQSFLDHFGYNSDSVTHYLELASNEYLEGELWEQYVTTLNAYCSFYAQINEYEKSQMYANWALEESKKHFSTTDIMYAVSLGNHSFQLMYTGNYKQAIKQFKSCLVIERLHDSDKTLIGSSLKNIGDAYNELGDLDEALNYYNELIAYNEANGNFMKTSLARIYRRQGIAYFRKNKSELALQSFRNAQNLISKTTSKLSYLNYSASIDVSNDIARLYLNKSNGDSLLYFVNQGLELCTGEYSIKKDEGYILLGSYFLKNKQYEEAIKNLLIAKEINARRFSKFKKHSTFSQVDILLASAYAKKGDNNKALALNIEAINNLKQYSESNIDKFELPNIDGITHTLDGIKAYKQIGEIYTELFKSSNSEKDLETAFKSYKNAAALVTDVRNSFQESSSLLRYSEVALPVYEATIALAIKMHERSSNHNYLLEAFNYSEKSKGILLLESINKLQAINLSSIPNSLKQKEKEYKLQISVINRKLYDELNVAENLDSFKIEQLKRLQFSETEEYDKLIRKIENEYPEYYQLKYNLRTANLEDIQSRLQNSETQLIEYFYGNDNIYTFSITHDDIKINTIPNHISLTNNIQNVKDFLSTPPSGKKIQSSLKQYIYSSKFIFDQFLKNSIHPESKHIIFICDGPLGYLPFEALITDKPNSQAISYSLDNLSYLIEDYDISYSYSSTLFLNSFNSKKQETENTFLGIAPSFDLINGNTTRVCNENALYSLECSEDEVMQIKNKLGGKVLIGKDATLSNTKKEITNAKIIHLATHACLDDSNPEFNKIYLSDDYLSNNDLYNLKLNSELAVLSACETGSGRLAKGEGVMSLARGFINAGCPSIIMSLWSIDDCATSKIMVDFYKELSQAKSKTEALRNAKLRYIKNAKRANQHPYYWAAFVQIGNYDPIEISSYRNYFIYSLGLLAMIIIFLLGWKKFKIS